MDQSKIKKLENGTMSLNLTTIEKLCGLYGCDEPYLIGENDEYIPIQFACEPSQMSTEDLEKIAMLNRIGLNIRFMNKKLEEYR